MTPLAATLIVKPGPMTLTECDRRLSIARLRLLAINSDYASGNEGSGVAKVELMLKVDRLLDVRLAITAAGEP